MPANNSCRSCGGAVSPNERFCSSCGSEQADIAQAPSETVLLTDSTGTHCTACGNPVDAATNFCPNCGASRLDAATVPSQGSLERITTDRLTEATTGEFEILQRIGHGAMGSVYLARDLSLSRRVAIKVISPHLLVDEAMVARFRLEAQTVAALRHPNIVNLHVVRQLGDLHFFIMDFIDGPSLRALMKAHAPLDISVAQALLFQIGSALGYAHRRGRGVIHRDVKPGNVMIDREGHAVVMDFGISKVGASRTGLTQTGATIGTPEYMSPEQCMDKELTGSSDQYALGIVAYEMLTGSVPFKGSTYAIMMAHAEQAPPSIREKRPDCPQEVDAAVLRMLAKSPGDRFSDLDSAVTALGGRPLGHGDPVRDTLVELVESVSSEAASLDESSPLSPVPASRAPQSITITGLPRVLILGEAFDLQVEADETPGDTLPGADVTWSTSDPRIASVRDGTLEAKSAGTVSLTAMVGGVANTVLLTVTAAAPAEVSVRPQSVTMSVGGSIDLEAAVLDDKGRSLDVPVRWVSESESIASVSPDGRVSAKAAGAGRILASVGDAVGHAQIEVAQLAPRAAAVSVPPPSAAETRRPADSVSGPRPGEESSPPAEAAGTRRSSGRWWVAAAAVLAVAVGLTQVVRNAGGGGGEGAPVTEIVTPPAAPLSATATLDTAAGAPGPNPADPPSGGTNAGSQPDTPDQAATQPPANEPTQQPPQQPSPTTGGAPTPAPGPVVTSVRIAGGDRALRSGASTPIRAAALTEAGELLEGLDTEWSVSDPTVAVVQNDELVGIGGGTATVTARVQATEANIEVTVLEPPTRDEIVGAIQRFIDTLRRSDQAGVSRFFGRGRGGQRQTDILERMRESNFNAQLTRLGDVQPSGAGASVDFDVVLSWRDGRGAATRRETSFDAALEPTPAGWRLADVTRRPDEGGAS